ncbi:MAG: DUF294 nucleotidyltransferase-like domain-containing protein [Azovibrio sp.]|nr:DUF294 nucleotidyltransferase-like domain-containing protein [Azovibrio sp.]
MAGLTQGFLKRHLPFQRMEARALDYLAERAALAFFAKGAEITGPGEGVARQLYIIEQGKVQSLEAAEVGNTGHAVLALGVGECFPIGAVTAARPSTNRYVAATDVSCYVLDAEDVFCLMEMSPEFNAFCTRYIATLLNQSRRQLQQLFAQQAGDQQTLNSPLAQVGSRAPVRVLRETPLRQALEIMSSAHVGSVAVVDADERPVGIFTRADLLDRVVLAGVGLDVPIAAVMTSDPCCLSEQAAAYDAMLAMAHRGIRHVLLVDAEGRLTGVVSERDLFALQRIGLTQIRQSIERAPDVAMLQQVAQDIRQLAFNMLAQGVGAEQLTQFISTLNDALTRRILELNLEQHDLYGIDWCWLAFGSEGRDEQTFSTDQDNGIIFVCDDFSDREVLKLRLLEFARAVNADLDRCGFPLCKGNIMASNPQWCLTLEEWQELFSEWMQRPQPEALLNASIFFDFRPLYGRTHLADRLRRMLLAHAAENPIFLRAMAVNALSVSPPLGMIRDFVTDLEPEHPGAIDLKKYGTRLFVDGARIYALAAGVYQTNTVLRLRQAAARLSFNEEEVSGIIEAFNYIQLLRLRQQQLDGVASGQGHNLIYPERLNELDRRILKEAFRQARKLQQKLRLDFQAG